MTARDRTAVQLREDLPTLIAQGILDERSAERLTAYYPLPAARDYGKRMILCFGILGALLFGGGLLMIVAHNWEHLALGGRLAIAYMPLLLTWLLGGWVLAKRKEATVWKEGASVLILSALGAGIGIVSQQYHSTGTVAELTTVLLLFDIALIYIFRSSAALLLYAAGFAVVTSAGYNEVFGIRAFYILLGLLLPVLWRIVGLLKEKPWGAAAHVCRIALTFMLCMLALSASLWKSPDNGALVPYLWAVLAACLLRFGLLSARVSRFNPFLLAGLAGMLIECSIFSFYEPWESLKPLDLSRLSHVSIFAGILATLLYSVIGWVSIMRDDKFIVWIPLIFPLLVLGNIACPMGAVSCVIFNGYLAFSGVYLLTRGVRRRRMWFVNFGMGILLLLIFLRFCGGSENYLVIGSAFVVSGLVFFAVNLGCSRWFSWKKEAAE